MIITAFQLPVAGYALAKDAGINTVWGGEPALCEKAGLQCVPALSANGLHPSQSSSYFYEVLEQGSVIGLSLKEDLQVSELSAIEETFVQLKNAYPDAVFPGLVSATYTRMLDYLGVESIEEYYRAFAQLCPSATPMLCHYPFHWMAEDDHNNLDDIVEYDRNLAMMESIFPSWWAWVQVSAHSHYPDADGVPEWTFDELGEAGVIFQVDKLVAAGCSGIGYFCWGPLSEGPGIVNADGSPSKYFSTVQGINRELGR